MGSKQTVTGRKSQQALGNCIFTLFDTFKLRCSLTDVCADAYTARDSTFTVPGMRTNALAQSPVSLSKVRSAFQGLQR